MATHRTLILAVVLAVCTAGGCSSATASGPDVEATAIASIPAEPAPSLDMPVAPSAATVLVAPDRTVEQSGGFRLTTLTSAACSAEAPADWAMQAPERSDRADVASPDGALYAGYGIPAVNTALEGYAYAYDPPLNDPGLYSTDPATVAHAYGRIIVGSLGGSADLVATEIFRPTTGYLLMMVSGPTHEGAIFFGASGYPGDGVNYSYALPIYFAFTTTDRWDGQGALVARVAASIRCRTQFQPPDDYPIVEAASAGEGGDANGDAAGYNPQLGTEPVSDPTTGENYLVDPSVNWSETGPEGPGYYVQKGVNDYLKLEPGRVD